MKNLTLIRLCFRFEISIRKWYQIIDISYLVIEIYEKLEYDYVWICVRFEIVRSIEIWFRKFNKIYTWCQILNILIDISYLLVFIMVICEYLEYKRVWIWVRCGIVPKNQTFCSFSLFQIVAPAFHTPPSVASSSHFWTPFQSDNTERSWWHCSMHRTIQIATPETRKWLCCGLIEVWVRMWK